VENPFPRTRAAFIVDSTALSVTSFLIALVLLVLWGLWLRFSKLDLYEQSASARLEVDKATYPVQSPFGGRVVASYLEIGRRVCPTDVLFELDTTQQQLDLQEAQVRLQALQMQVAALDRETETQTRLLAETDVVAVRTLAEARAHADQARSEAEFARERFDRFRRMQEQELVATLDSEHEHASATQSRLAAQAALRAYQRTSAERRTRVIDRQVQIDSLLREKANLQAQLLTNEATVNRLHQEIDRRRIYPATCGRLGDITTLHPGSVIEPGQNVATLIPTGSLRIVAFFPADRGLGRLRAGQHGEVRLHGFSWTEFGALPADITSVSTEPRDGTLRVEAAILPNQRFRVPLQHGLSGTFEVNVESVSPYSLLVRTLGFGTTQQRNSPNEFSPRGPEIRPISR